MECDQQPRSVRAGCSVKRTPPVVSPRRIEASASSAGTPQSIDPRQIDSFPMDSGMMIQEVTRTMVETKTSTMVSTATVVHMVDSSARPISFNPFQGGLTTVTERATTTTTVFSRASSADSVGRSTYLHLAIAGLVFTALTMVGVVFIIFVLLRTRRDGPHRKYYGVPLLSRTSTMSSVRGLLDAETQSISQSQSESPAHALPLRTSPNQRRYTSIVTSVTLSRLPPAAISTRDSVISDASEHTQELSHVPDLSDPPVQQYATAGSYRASGLQSRGTSIGSSLPPAYDDLSDRGREASPIGDASESGPGQ